MADLLPDAADEGLQRAGLTQFSSESWSVHYAGAHDLQLFFQTVIPKATEIIRPVVTKYGYPATQDGEALALCMSPRVLICWSAASLLPLVHERSAAEDTHGQPHAPCPLSAAGASQFTSALTVHEADPEISSLVAAMKQHFLPDTTPKT